MQIYPAIDIKNGKAVRLIRGEYNAVTDYGDPVSAALDWKQQGATYLHVVDLNGAFEGSGRNLPTLREIVKQTSLPVETGGGIRTMKDIENRLSVGVQRVILGTVALNHPEIVEEACKKFSGHIAVGLDCKNGLVAVKGWVETSTVTAKELALRMKEYGVRDIIYTDISRDGMLVGPNVAATKQLIIDTDMNIIGSGGISSLRDLIDLKEAGCAGAIIGKALYSGKVKLSDALKLEE